jgi:hypothetical protein
MAYRKIHDSFWTDPDVEELTPEQKYFYIYLITNPSVNQIGLYEFSIKRACFETGYNADTVEKLLQFFEKHGKIKRSDESREIVVCKFYYHNMSHSPKVQSHVNKLLEEVKDTSLIQYIYSMYTQSQEEEVQEEEEAQDNGKQVADVPSLSEVKEYFNSKGYDSELATKFYSYYDEPMRDRNGRVWKDQNGKTVKSWKQKAVAVWMKDEGKSQFKAPKGNFV